MNAICDLPPAGIYPRPKLWNFSISVDKFYVLIDEQICGTVQFSGGYPDCDFSVAPDGYCSPDVLAMFVEYRPGQYIGGPRFSVWDGRPWTPEDRERYPNVRLVMQTEYDFFVKGDF